MNEGADILMVKPGMPYLDIVREVKDKVLMLLEGDSMQPKSVWVGCGRGRVCVDVWHVCTTVITCTVCTYVLCAVDRVEDFFAL